MHLLDNFLLRVRCSCVLGMQLTLLLFDLMTELFEELVVLEDESLLLSGVLLEALALALVEFVESLGTGPLLIGLVLRLSQFVLQVFGGLPHVTLSRLHLALVDLRLLGAFLFGNRLSLVDLPDELFFLEGQLLALKLDHLELLFVFAGELRELDLPLAEGIRLQLVLLVDSHQLLQLALLSRHVRHHTPRLAHQLDVLLLCLVQSEFLVLFTLDNLAQLHIQGLEAVPLLRLELLSQVLVERVLLLEQGDLFSHLFRFKIVSSLVLFELGEHLTGLSKLGLQELVCLEEFVTFAARQLQVSLDLVK